MVGERKLLVRGLGKESIEKTVALTLVILACGFLPPPRSRLAGGQRADKSPSGTAAGLSREAIIARAESLAVPFVRNAGRFVKEVRFSADLFAGRFFLTDQELVYSLVKNSGKKSAQPDRTGWSTLPAKNAPKKGIAFKEYFVNEKGSRIYFEPFGEEKGTTKISYFRGNNPAKWQSGLASYNSVSLGDVYPGIQVKLRASGKNIEKIFHVRPQGDVACIRIGVAGVAGLKIAADGRLIFKNSLGELAMRAPVAWQEIAGRRQEVKVGYRLLGKQRYGFLINGAYDKSYPLVIDPELDTLLASTFLGGSWGDTGIALALDRVGNVYITGNTRSDDFPTTVGAYDRTINPIYDEDYYPDSYPDDIFVSKLDAGLTQLLASTYLGGEMDPTVEIDNFDFAYSLAVDGSGNVIVVGSTNSADFPTTPGAYDRVFNYEDVFISKLNDDLTRLLASTYLGGDGSDRGRSMALDSSDDIYLAGNTSSENFPTTPGAYERRHNYASDAFVSKLNGQLTELLASTYLGGSQWDYAYSLVLGDANVVYLAGKTESTDFPTSAGAYDRTYNGDGDYYSSRGDVFISKLNGDLSSLLASTYLGGSSEEGGNSLALDSAGNIYLTGGTSSANFPTTREAYDRRYSGGDRDVFGFEGDVFISRLTGDLTRLLASTFLGGNNSESGKSLVLNRAGNVILTGETLSEDFPTTSGAYDRVNKTGRYYIGDAFVSKLNDNLSGLLASTFLGGGSSDRGKNLVLDHAGNVYLTGYGTQGFPTTPGAYDRSLFAGAFISKLSGRADFAMISPNGGESWVAGTIHEITWDASANIADVGIEVSTDNGSSWSAVGVSPARYHKFAWTVPNTPSRQCLVRINDNVHPTISDTSDAVFSILMNIDLVAERREVRTFSIVRQYGRVHFLIGNASVPVAQYRILRRQDDGDFILLKEIAPSELQNGQFQMQDKYLEKGTTYTYRIEGFNASGQLIGISPEKTI